jgi:peptidoglycan/LPS O-acetylase OafA/YrhL
MLKKIESPHKELKSLQILRAIAATSVVYFHIGAVPVFGSFGVDIFFVLSGFVMALVVSQGQPAKEFAINRISRIVPLYWILTTGILILAAIRPDLLNSTTANFENYLKSLLFIPYFKENGALNPMLAVGWTLNYEMFFYLTVWLCLALTYRQLNRVIFLTGFLLVCAYLLVGNLKNDSAIATFLGSSLLFEFLLGMICFKLYQLRILKLFKHWQLFSFAALCYAVMACAEVFAVKLDRAVIYGLPSVLFILSAVSFESSSVIKSKMASLLSIIGDGSYATYLSHSYVVEGIRKIAHQKLNLIDPYQPAGVLTIILASLLLGHFIYIMIDKPLSTFFKKRFSSKPAQPQP